MGNPLPHTSRVPALGVLSSLVAAADIFHSFANLPIEIRLMIWKSCFPARQDMDLRPPDASYKWQSRELPITLWINNESRKETLRNYVFEVLKGNDMGDMQILCFRPKHDILYFDISYDNRWRRNVRYHWLLDSLQRHPDWFNKVHTLEIREWRYPPYARNDMIDHLIVSSALDCIALVPNLRNLKVVEDVMLSSPFRLGSENDVAESKRRVTEEVQKRVNLVGAGHALGALNISIHRAPARSIR